MKKILQLGKCITLLLLTTTTISCEKESNDSHHLYKGTASARVINSKQQQRVITDSTPCIHRSESEARQALYDGIKYLMWTGEAFADNVQYSISKCD
ncbi:hypothetical protein [Sphingobacterium paucimobilis]|uniref:Uncharacterized protein n=1 Tax=Sphingobacterium paucimobilis HER1398 TaxID=1346330 RepID=U2HFX8_9SPHI|nr:hypothetical protein [Sphingobacterium paucimobilis]ERJ60661.1 hypothetical protein M472_18040 [Sphingobacterium paucimobilis HER1398]